MTKPQFPFHDSFRDAAAVTPSDTVDLPDGPCRGIYVGGAGAVKIVTTNGSTVTFAAVPVGTFMRVGAVRIFSTGTTATNLLALY